MVHHRMRGQSTLEYVLLVTAVIVIIIGLVASPNSPFRVTLNKSLNKVIQDIGGQTDKLRQHRMANGAASGS